MRRTDDGDKREHARSECGECGKETTLLVQIGEEYGYETETAFVCKECIEKALRLFDDK